MNRPATTLVVIAIVAASCGDSVEAPRDYIEPVPFDPTTTLAAEAPAETTTTLGFLASAVADARARFDDLVVERGLEVVPAEVWGDFAYAGCAEGIWDRGVNFALAEDLSEVVAPFVQSFSLDQVLVAELLWLLSVELCAEDFPQGEIGRGSPMFYEYPRCPKQLKVWALPWSDEVREPDVEEDHSIGIVGHIWLEGELVFAITQGADPTFDDQYASGVDIGGIRGNPATALEGGPGVVVLWRENAGHCGAFRMLLHPRPETDDLAAFAQSLLQPPAGLFSNPAEIRMAATVPLVEGYTDIGGEPSHGGLDAVYAFEDDTGWYDVRAVPTGIEADPVEVNEVVEVDGTAFEFFRDNSEDGPTPGVRFEADGYRITVRAAAFDDRLLAFAREFNSAWLAAGAP